MCDSDQRRRGAEENKREQKEIKREKSIQQISFVDNYKSRSSEDLAWGERIFPSVRSETLKDCVRVGTNPETRSTKRIKRMDESDNVRL